MFSDPENSLIQDHSRKPRLAKIYAEISGLGKHQLWLKESLKDAIITSMMWCCSCFRTTSRQQYEPFLLESHSFKDYNFRFQGYLTTVTPNQSWTWITRPRADLLFGWTMYVDESPLLQTLTFLQLNMCKIAIKTLIESSIGYGRALGEEHLPLKQVIWRSIEAGCVFYAFQSM